MIKNYSEMLKLYKPKTLFWYNKLKFFLFPFVKLEALVPKAGFIIDLGCSHGLLANFLGLTSSEREILGVEMNENRLKFANIGIKNTKFQRIFWYDLVDERRCYHPNQFGEFVMTLRSFKPVKSDFFCQIRKKFMRGLEF